MAKKKTDSAAARAKQSARTLEEVIPIESRSAKQNQQRLERLQSQPKENLKENLKGPRPLRR